MATFTKLNGFVENLAEKVFNLGSDTLTVALSNTAPGSESTPPTGTAANCKLSNVTQISYANCSTRAITTSSSAQSSGTYKLVMTPLTLTASGGTVGPFILIKLSSMPSLRRHEQSCCVTTTTGTSSSPCRSSSRHSTTTATANCVRRSMLPKHQCGPLKRC